MKIKNQGLQNKGYQKIIGVVGALMISGCGGGGGSSSTDNAAASPPSAISPPGSVSSPPTELPRIVSPNPSQKVLAMPSGIVDGSTVDLQCGQLYYGTLNLANRSNVTVRTVGDCGKATLSPAQAVTGWTRHQGSIWSAPISFSAKQVIINGQPSEAAHWPSKTQVWATATTSSSDSVSYVMPNGDLTGATLVFKQYDWTIEARTISSYANNTMRFSSTRNPSFDGRAPSGQVKFYVEGKLWMLDEPNEWAVQDGRLYVWTADGQSPEGRIWASPDAHGIDAANSKQVSVENVHIYGASNGIHAAGASNLRVSNTEIINSAENGIHNTGGAGLAVDGSVIRNTRHDAVIVKWGGGNESIKNSVFDSTGVLGMPTNSRGAIALTLSSGASVMNNRVVNSGYIGIRVFQNAVVSGNTIDGACQVLTDCGGVYASAPERQALNTRIENNVIKNVSPSQRLSWGVQLDDANGVTIANNTFAGNYNGIMIFNGFNHTISGNRFSQSTQAHIQMAESRSGAVRNNTVTGNTFSSIKEEMYRVSSDFGAGVIPQFGTYGSNTYISGAAIFANYNGARIDFSQWKSRTGQDASSNYSTP